MPAKTRDKLTAQLFRAVLSLKDEQQCSNFFEDICTITDGFGTVSLRMVAVASSGQSLGYS